MKFLLNTLLGYLTVFLPYSTIVKAADVEESFQDAFLSVSNPNTGDNSNMTILIVIAVVAVLILIGLKIYMNKSNKK